LGRGRVNRKRINLASNKGYLLVSTLFFLVLSGLFSSSIIQVSGNHIIQLKQLATSYEAKSALNMSKQILAKEIKNSEIPTEGVVETSLGDVSIAREETDDIYTFTLTLTTTSGTKYSDDLQVAILEPEEEQEELEDEGPAKEPEEVEREEGIGGKVKEESETDETLEDSEEPEELEEPQVEEEPVTNP